LQIEGSSINDLKNSTPYAIELNPNYPNPTFGNTSISFEMRESGEVSLKVYNLIGDEIVCLADGFKPAGKYILQFNTSYLAAGVYIYTLTSKNARVSKRMNVMK
jgi:hypothetical protein